MSPRERADSRTTLYMTGNHAIANRRQISLREAILPVLVTCVPSCWFFSGRGRCIFPSLLHLRRTALQTVKECLSWIFFGRWLLCLFSCLFLCWSAPLYASVNSSSAHPPPGNRGAFAHVVSPGGGAFAILSRPRGLGISIPRGDPRAFDNVFSKDI